MIHQNLLASYKQLAGCVNNNNSNTDPVYEAMVRATKSSLEVVECKSRCNVLRSLKKQRIGTSCVESLTARLCKYKDSEKVFKNGVKRKIVNIVMNEKLNDAYTEYRLSKVRNMKVWRECKKIITGEVRRGYVTEWSRYMKREVRRVQRDEVKKVEWLVSKWKQEEVVPEVFEGITIKCNEEYPTEFNNEPREYGGVTLDETEKKALKLPPKFALSGDIDAAQCRIQLEESLNKLRWNDIIEEDIEDLKFYNPTTKTVDIRKMKATSLPFNPNVKMPWAIKEEKEVRLSKFRVEVMNKVKEMQGENRKSMWNNLSQEEKVGLNKLRKRVKEKEIVCCVTDKSGRWACETQGSYREACMEELKDPGRTPEISMEEHERGEKELNSHAAALLRMMGLEEDEETGESRLRLATQAHGTSLAPFYGLRKDHKQVPPDEAEKGPRVRPICGAEECSTKRVSYILCRILTPLISRGSTQCDSTDELLREFEKVNSEREADGRWVLGSLDVDSLYPSLDVYVCSVVSAKELIESDLVFNNLNWREIALYLQYQVDRETLDCWATLLEREEIGQWCPQRRCVRGRPPTFEASGSSTVKETRYEPWVFPEGEPEESEIRTMFGIAVGIMVKRTMELHDFCIDGRVFRQKKGGSIGLDLTGVVSDIFMCRWDRMLLERMQTCDLEAVVYKRYKDDINFVLEVGGAEAQTEIGHERDRRVMTMVQRLANENHASLTVTVDSGYNHPERQGRLPILDLEVWIGEGSDGTRRIMHSHYMKDVTSRLVMEMRSAHGDNTKRNVMMNEICRIMKNCSVYLGWDEVASKVSYFVKRMAYCGYDEKFRYNVVKLAVGRHKKRVERWEKGEGMFEDCPGERERLEAAESKRRWYKNDKKHDSVMFVQPTPNSQLKKSIQVIARKNGLKIKVVEKAGQTVKKVLQRSNPFGRDTCKRTDCLVCKVGEPGICKTRGCVYQLMCKEDNRVYRGQTGRSLYERFKEEVRDWWNQEESSPLWRHAQLFHNGEEFDVGVEVLSECFGKPSRRMITEAVAIEELKDDETMNSKREWTYTKLNKLQVT